MEQGEGRGVSWSKPRTMAWMDAQTGRDTDKQESMAIGREG